MRDHGGNIDAAKARFGGADWIDLSTGINRVPYPIPVLTAEAWTALPTAAALVGLTAAAARAYATSAMILPVAGAQAAIQMIPRLGPAGRARVLAPTYNEHAASLRAAGWQVDEVGRLADLAGADLAVVVNPNNPDGQTHAPAALLALAAQVGRLVVDESFADARADLSVAPQAGQRGLFVLRSFGKFYGLAGLRLGFVLGHPEEIADLAQMAGPWPVSGAAIQIGQAALADANWAAASIARLRADVARLDALAIAVGWNTVGGTELFRLYDTPDAPAAQARLARAAIWSRIFPASPRWLRLGLPGRPVEWARLETVFRS
ncbi:threonine-phosphate decarboxylase [Rhodobacter veldkampii DSM 11550]|uniref:threonine-phosphate decarboxylase n=1 Tax=Phaeovulum veldkampii DSM 11550 TaxID=1185920 RepID=A0A2T4JLK1_9RHOB|nr:threonine-phosphate decarboxylase CobD [Phaeovulum veldkampii]MBK5946533.1 threonine-phosphate decarboxylase [Phaeovulum veldkampii DSM 11550]PTE18774.1 threonine-phosphate decarboxylase [Phaeovulum veldkampii DSM 11550]TDQ60012.1 L-threonine O-3-phosphate decarboxylase [Phaeovulum veldkampii DSM 11550]